VIVVVVVVAVVAVVVVVVVVVVAVLVVVVVVVLVVGVVDFAFLVCSHPFSSLSALLKLGMVLNCKARTRLSARTPCAPHFCFCFRHGVPLARGTKTVPMWGGSL